MNELIEELIEKTRLRKLSWKSEVSDTGARYYYNPKTKLRVFQWSIRVGGDVIIYNADDTTELDSLRKVIATRIRIEEMDRANTAYVRMLKKVKGIR